MKRLDILVTYDVSTESREGRRRLRKVAQICQNYGQRVQLSVFECKVTQAQFEEMEARLVQVIDESQDSLRFYLLHRGREKAAKTYGIDHYRDFEDPLVI